MGKVFWHRHRIARCKRGCTTVPCDTPMPAHGHQNRGEFVAVFIATCRGPRDEINLEPRLVAQDAIFTDHFGGRLVGQRDQVPVAGDVVWQNVGCGWLRTLGQLFVSHQWHGRDAIRQPLLALGVIELAVFAEDQAVGSCVFDDLRSPHDTAASVVTSKDRHDHSVIGTDVFKPAKDTGGNIENITFFEGHFARLRLLDPDRYFDISRFREEEARYAPVNELVQLLMSKDAIQQLESEPIQHQLADFLGASALEALNTELKGSENDQETTLKRLIRELLDRHGTGRVLFRNTRASVQGFPPRELHQHLLQAPEMFNAAGDLDHSDFDELDARLTPELLLGEQWLQTDPRVGWLVDFLAQQRGDKILVICARTDTAIELEQHLNLKHGVHSAVFHEGLSLVGRDRAAAYFADEDQGAQVLVCSEIGSEGRNFQFSSQLVLFDLPLNPDLLEQRIGRLDRIGQRHNVILHVPCFQHSAQEVLLRWYHEGINAFEKTCAIGQTQYQRFEKALKDCMLNPQDRPAADKLIQQTRKSSETLLTKLREGRDRLLELNSCDSDQAELIVEDIHEQEQRHALSAYMEKIFDQFGVDQEHHTATSVILRPGEHMLGHSFPSLPDDGVTATYQRDMALAREEFQYLTWEHPMVTGAMDMVMSGEFGNTAFCTMKLPPFKAGTILLEGIFTMSSPAPTALQLHRYLPLTSIRIVVDSKQNDLSNILTEKHFNKLGKRVRRHSAQEFIRHTRAQIVAMIAQAEKLAEKQEQSIVDGANEQMQTLQQQELQRLQALAEVNPNIRQEEIDYLLAETSELQHYLGLSHIKLEALRLAVITE